MARQYLRSHFSEDVSVLRLARILGISRSSLHEQSSRRMGMNPPAIPDQPAAGSGAQGTAGKRKYIQEIIAACGIRTNFTATVAVVAVTAATGGVADGLMVGGVGAFGGSVIGGAVRTIKNARAGITIEKMGEFERVAEIANVRHYSGLKEFKFMEKAAGRKVAEKIGWWQNKCVVKGVMMLKGPIYDCGGALTGAYAKEAVFKPRQAAPCTLRAM